MPSFATFGNQLYTGERSIEFVRRQKTWYAISGVLLVLSLVGLFGRGLNLGLEFKGGSEFRINNAKTTNDVVGVNAVHSVDASADAEVTKIGTNSIRVQTSKFSDTGGQGQDNLTSKVADALAKAYGVNDSDVSSTFIGPSWGSDISKKALQGLIVFLILVSLVIAFYFRTWTMAVAGIVALLHDLLITAGIYALVGFEVSPASVIGFLTILGYSLYDTVVVFDKVRENTQNLTATAKSTYSEAANLAVNQTLVRSINTSVVALLPIASILVIGTILVGAGTLEDLSLALFVGIATGTYSSIFIATPLLADLREREPEMKALRTRVLKRRAAQAGQAAPVAVTAAGAPGAAASGDGGTSEAGSARGSAAPTVTVTATRGGTPARSGPRNQPKRAKKKPSGKRR
jgi:preprotein translocase subunit SecF